MARERSRTDDKGFGKKRINRSKGWVRKRYLLLFTLMAILVGIGYGVPKIASNRDFVVSMANKYGGIEPLRVDIDSISMGWLSPIQVKGFRILDDSGENLLRVGRVESEKGILSLARNYMSLGTIIVADIEMAVDVQPGTTSLEESIKPVLVRWFGEGEIVDAPDVESAPTALPTGRIHVENIRLNLRDSIDLASWQIVINEADLPLPTAEQAIPPLTLVGSIRQLSNQPDSGRSSMNSMGSSGEFTIRTSPIHADPNQADGHRFPAMQMRIVTTEVPLEWFSLVRRRFPTIPLESVDGMATIQAEIDLLSAEQIEARITTAQIDRLALRSKELLGES